jgi:hypothetical protein
MPTTLTIPEVLEKIARSSNRDEVVHGLRANSSLALKQLLHYAYFDSSKWYRSDLPPYTPDGSPEGLTISTLFSEVKRLYVFKESYNLPKERKDVLLIQILESVHPDEARMIKDLLSGKFASNYLKIDRNTIQEAFPDIADAISS